MRLAFLPPDDKEAPQEEPAEAGGKRLAIQPYPGPLRYAPMSQFLSGFASLFGCAHCSCCSHNGRLAASQACMRTPCHAVSALDNKAPPCRSSSPALPACLGGPASLVSSRLQITVSCVQAGQARHLDVIDEPRE